MSRLILKTELDVGAADTNASLRIPGPSWLEVFRAADEMGKLRNLEVNLVKVRYIDAAESRRVYLGQQVLQILARATEIECEEREKGIPR